MLMLAASSVMFKTNFINLIKINQQCSYISMLLHLLHFQTNCIRSSLVFFNFHALCLNMQDLVFSGSINKLKVDNVSVKTDSSADQSQNKKKK